jgi:hypothetical protein
MQVLVFPMNISTIVSIRGVGLVDSISQPEVPGSIRVQFYSGMRRSPSESNGKLLTYNAWKITIQLIRLESDKQRSEKGMQTNLISTICLYVCGQYALFLIKD